MQQNIKTHCS